MEAAHCKNHEQNTKGCGDCRFARLVQMDRYDVVYPRGVPTVVPRGECRCPILSVGDFCPVHGG